MVLFVQCLMVGRGSLYLQVVGFVEDLNIQFEMFCYQLFKGSNCYGGVDFEIFFIVDFLDKFEFQVCINMFFDW